MAEYFDTREAAEEEIRRWKKQGASIPFYARIRDSGSEKWMVDFRVKNYGDAITILEDLSHTVPSIG